MTKVWNQAEHEHIHVKINMLQISGEYSDSQYIRVEEKMCCSAPIEVYGTKK